MASIDNVLRTKGSQLHHLEIVAPISALSHHRKPLGNFLVHAPNLLYLKISIDFMGDTCLFTFDDEMARYALRQIDFDCFNPADCYPFQPDKLYLALAYSNNGKAWGRLRKVRIHRRLGWQSRGEIKRCMADLDELLKAHAREDAANTAVEEADAGLIFYGTG